MLDRPIDSIVSYGKIDQTSIVLPPRPNTALTKRTITAGIELDSTIIILKITQINLLKFLI